MSSRMGEWQPATVEERLDRLESIAELRQLVMRYAVHLYSRNLDPLCELFEPNVVVGQSKVGREAIKEWFNTIMRAMRTTIHHVENHMIDFQDAEHATGVVYCTDELERVAAGEWEIGVLQYWDNYVRVDGRWYFSRRRLHRWYICDALTRPGHAVGVGSGADPLKPRLLPDAYPSWALFWDTGDN
ncbi:MAG: nuclear transport factor 2 family protein [Acidimicrobiia bacterium]